MTLPTYYAYNGIPSPIPFGDSTPCVAINGKIGQMRDAGKSLYQTKDSIKWRTQANGPLLSRLRFDVTSKQTTPHTFCDSGWTPYFIASIPFDEWYNIRSTWTNAGWAFKVSPIMDIKWLVDIFTVYRAEKKVPCPYVSLNHSKKIITIHSFVLNLTRVTCRIWIVQRAAKMLRIRYGKVGLGIDGWEAALKSKFWRHPQSNRSTPDNPMNGGAITDTPFASGAFEVGYQETLKDLYTAGFKMLVSDFPRPGDTSGDWLDKDVAVNLLGNWRSVRKWRKT
jgi:hypothetical protein